MPLLRLLHQITNMYQNVKDTQSELKEQEPPADVKIPPPKPPPPTGTFRTISRNRKQKKKLKIKMRIISIYQLICKTSESTYHLT